MADWRSDLLRRLGYPVTPANLQFLTAWGQAEGGGGIGGPNTTKYNWLNTSWEMPGSERFNSHNVQSYPSYETGIAATAKTLGLGYYDQIRQLLSRGDAPLSALAQAVYSSPWGTKSGIGAVTSSAPAPSAAVGTAGGGTANTAPSTSFFQNLLGATTERDPQKQTSALLNMLLAPKSPTQQAPGAQTATPSPSGGAPGNVRFTTNGGSPPGVREMFYDPRGAYDEGKWISPIGGHSDHVHLSFGDPRTALGIMSMAKKMGLRVGENPYYDTVDPVHTKTSYHYQLFPGMYDGRRLGRAADISGSSQLMSALWDAILRGGYL